MLNWLSIQGLALVDRVELSFDRSLNVLTGETGAGKSLILGSIALLLGERADPEWIRAGEDRGFVEGVFDLSDRADLVEALRRLDVASEEERVILRRELTGEGKSRALVNGRTVLLSQLRSVGELLVDLHGQHEHQHLLEPEHQTDFFDAWSGLLTERRELEHEREAIGVEARSLEEARVAWERDRLEQEQALEDYAELERAALEPEEEDRLKEERERARHRERTLETLRAARHSLASEETGAESLVARAARSLRSLATTVPAYADLAVRAESLLESMGELSDAIDEAEERAVEDPTGSDRIEERLDLIHRLKRKHRMDFPSLLEHARRLGQRVGDFRGGEGEFQRREAALRARAEEFERRLDRFVERRRERCTAFEGEIASRLAKLGFPKASFAVVFVAIGTGRRGPAIDPPSIPGLEFQFRPNPGEPARSLRRIASGGELSRIMLAVKSSMADRDQVAVLVFDEVDQGIGGAVGEEVGRTLRALAARRQVLCITHLPLIAAHGTRHFEVVKSTARGRTQTSVRTLTEREREEEISRLLAGDRVTATTRRQAREILRAARGPEAEARPPALSRRAASGGA